MAPLARGGFGDCCKTQRTSSWCIRRRCPSETLAELSCRPRSAAPHRGWQMLWRWCGRSCSALCGEMLILAAPLTHAPLPVRLISSPMLLSPLVGRSAPVLLLGRWSLPAGPGVELLISPLLLLLLLLPCGRLLWLLSLPWGRLVLLPGCICCE